VSAGPLANYGTLFPISYSWGSQSQYHMVGFVTLAHNAETPVLLSGDYA